MFPFTQGQLHDDSSAFGRGSVSFEWFSVVSDDITASATTGFLSVVAEVRNGFGSGLAFDLAFGSGVWMHVCVCVAWGAGFLSMLLWGINRLGVWLIKDVPGRYLAGWLW